MILPVLMTFFVMSFLDLAGTGVDELKQSAEIPVYILQLIPFVAFAWYFVLSVPVGVWLSSANVDETKPEGRRQVVYPRLISWK